MMDKKKALGVGDLAAFLVHINIAIIINAVEHFISNTVRINT